MRRQLLFSFLIITLMLLIACQPQTEEPIAVPDSAPETGASEVVAVAPTVEPTAPPPPTLPPPVVTGSEDNEVAVEAAGEEPVVVVEEPAAVGCPRPWPVNSFGHGVQSHATIGDPAYTMEVVGDQLGMEWIKVQMEWPLAQAGPDEYRWEFYDGVVAESTAKGLCLMFSVVGSPSWARAAGNEIGPPDDYNLYANFLQAMIARYPQQIAAIEVWNEQNLDREWQTPNGVSPEDYVQFLAVAHQAIKAADPDIVVISGALAPTGDGDWVRWADDFAWMDRALAAGMLQYADCVGAHHNGYNIPPDVAFDQTGTLNEAATAIFRGPFDNPHHSWSFKTTLDTYAQKAQAIDPAMRLCITEFGWASSEGYDTFPTGFEFAQDNTLDEQATYLVQAFDQMVASGDVWIAFAFNFDFGNKGGGPTDDPVPYSIIDTRGIPRPAFGALAELDKTP